MHSSNNDPLGISLAQTPCPAPDPLYNRCLIKASICGTLTPGQACAKHLTLVSNFILKDIRTTITPVLHVRKLRPKVTQ